ncbi:malonyl-ACP O-methyltransferase BioC [Spirabiliibacterium falconis]|uniref:malonyl-ACP O-methyltransferase BioC n=1 Tax=Spirabiliibacterium falconis TaxID=572023 RepID=UPI001AADA257|nr:malonyl-ACP O-methyltransferase BioC [Spirabiliibacterium falconis]MBE2894336.1 malonyl-ACP O-methyltransferase BioC [Spirabiliibacterium falconis]
MSAAINKQRVVQRFAKALATYDNHACVQQAVNQRLMALLIEKCGCAFAHVLEVGCGSGDLTALIYRDLCVQQGWHNDINPLAVEQVAEKWQGEHTHFFCADGEELKCTLPLVHQFDLWLSGSTVQWFHQPERIVAQAQLGLRQGGVLAFSTFLSHNLYEIRTLTGKGLHYPTQAQWQAWLEPHFTLVALEACLCPLDFPTPRAVLKHLQATGVTATAHMPWNKTRLQKFEQSYCTQFATPTGVQLTYNPLIIIAKRK